MFFRKDRSVFEKRSKRFEKIGFVFLSKQGRKSIGWTKPVNYSWLFIAIAIRLIFSFTLYLAGELLYGDSNKNWYLYIGNSYTIPPGINPNDKLIMFVMMALSGMIYCIFYLTN